MPSFPGPEAGARDNYDLRPGDHSLRHFIQPTSSTFTTGTNTDMEASQARLDRIFPSGIRSSTAFHRSPMVLIPIRRDGCSHSGSVLDRYRSRVWTRCFTRRNLRRKACATTASSQTAGTSQLRHCASS